MESFTPLINLFLLLSVLSVAAERVTNVVKLRRPTMRTALAAPDEEKDREKQITQVSLLSSVLLAILVKADMFELVNHLDAPWETLGWLRLRGAEWFRSEAMTTWSGFLYALGGSAVTGLALGFGSKFWHEMLDLVLNMRQRIKQTKEA